MNRRPPQRHVRADLPGEGGEASVRPFPTQAVSPAQSESMTAPQPVREMPVVSSPQEFRVLLAELREQGDLAAADEAAILREYDTLVLELREEKRRLEVEYRERSARDGQDATNDWLAGAAEALGRRQGERMRQLMATIPTFAENANAAPTGA